MKLLDNVAVSFTAKAGKGQILALLIAYPVGLLSLFIASYVIGAGLRFGLHL